MAGRKLRNNTHAHRQQHDRDRELIRGLTLVQLGVLAGGMGQLGWLRAAPPGRHGSQSPFDGAGGAHADALPGCPSAALAELSGSNQQVILVCT